MDGESILFTYKDELYGLKVFSISFWLGGKRVPASPQGKNDLPEIHVNYGRILGSQQTLG